MPDDPAYVTDLARADQLIADASKALDTMVSCLRDMVGVDPTVIIGRSVILNIDAYGHHDACLLLAVACQRLAELPDRPDPGRG